MAETLVDFPLHVYKQTNCVCGGGGSGGGGSVKNGLAVDFLSGEQSFWFHGLLSFYTQREESL